MKYETLLSYVAILFEASPGFGAVRRTWLTSPPVLSQSSLKRVLVSEAYRTIRAAAEANPVAILFEASPGFGEARALVAGFIRSHPSQSSLKRVLVSEGANRQGYPRGRPHSSQSSLKRVLVSESWGF